MREFSLKRYVVAVEGYGCAVYDASTTGKARSRAYRSDVFHGWTFKDFLRRCRVWRSPEVASPNYGREITVSGQRAFYVSGDSQYVRFVPPGSDQVLISHPLDIEPDELRQFHYRDAQRAKP